MLSAAALLLALTAQLLQLGSATPLGAEAAKQTCKKTKVAVL